MANIDKIFTEGHSLSRMWHQRACKSIPNGVTHDLRNLKPFPLYVSQADGSKKWDLDGNEYIDYWMGHGSLILGHLHPSVVHAVQEQLSKGTHYGACSELEVLWAEKIIEMIPCAEKVRFLASGTEATMMAISLARAFTKKKKIIKFEGHFHGWHDQLSIGVIPPFDVPTSPAVPKEMLSNTIVVPPDNLEVLESVLLQDSDIAGIIMEATGGSSGTYPMFGEQLQKVRELTQHHGAVLIFDEIITGFRISPGGAQEYFDVIPDLTCLGKIMCGGLPGGAVVGRKEIMEMLESRGDPEWDRYHKIRHFGTQNASPLSAAAGLACLEIIAQGEVIPRTNLVAQKLRDALNAVIDHHSVNSCVYGFSSIFHTLLNHSCQKRGACDYQHCDHDYREIYNRNPLLLQLFWNALVNRGVDSMVVHGTVSSAHSEDDIQRTVEAFDYAIAEAKARDLLTSG